MAGVFDPAIFQTNVFQTDVPAPPSPPSGSGGGGSKGSLLPRGKPFRKPFTPLPEVVAHSLMDNLVTEYGVIHGREVYFAMQREMKGPFAPGNKYDVTLRPQALVEPAHPIVRAAPAPAARRN